MRFVVFGLTMTSSCGPHATLWRALLGGLVADGHHVTFFERSTPHHSKHRDLVVFSGCDIRIYANWAELLPQARAALAKADVGLVSAPSPDAVETAEIVLGSRVPLRAFYDLDTASTLAQWSRTQSLPYVGKDRLADFDWVFSVSGGGALDALRARLGARRVAPLYPSVDPLTHRPDAMPTYPGMELAFLGNYAEERQSRLAKLLLHPARLQPHKRFLLGGADYPVDFPWSENLWYVAHVPPADHGAFYSSARLALNVTRKRLADMGHCPSVRLFEAAACGVPILTDRWPGLSDFFTPGEEVLVARDTDDAMDMLSLSDESLTRMARVARERTLAEHNATRRAREFVARLASAGEGAHPTRRTA